MEGDILDPKAVATFSPDSHEEVRLGAPKGQSQVHHISSRFQVSKSFLHTSHNAPGRVLESNTMC